MTSVHATRQAILVLAALGLFIATGCEDKAKEKTNETAATTAETTADTTTKEEPGVEKLIFAFQPQENPEGLQLNGKKLAEFMEKETGIKCEIFVPTSYAAVVEALRGNNAHVAYFSGWPYLIAHNTAGVELLVAEERDGKPFPNQILFESGSAKLSPQGVKVLTQVGTALSNLEAQRRILLAGHTDNVPIAAKAKEFDSNWALSAKRARAALDVMIKAGVPTDVLGMAGFGEFDPIADNSSDDGKAQNRRTEIVLIPDLEKILEASAKKSAENVTMR